MHRFISSTFAIIVVLPTIAFARDSVHTGYWKDTALSQSTEMLACRGVTSEDDMVDVLLSAGWRIEDGIPMIDWSSDEAVIIAKDENLDFYGLFETSDEIFLSYGPSQVSSDEGIGSFAGGNIFSGGGGRVTSSASIPPRRNKSIIVISHPKHLDKNRDFFCQMRLP